MLKNIFIIAMISIFIFSVSGVYAAGTELNQPTAKPFEKTKDRASRGMNNILLGPTEIPDNLADSQTKGTKVDGYTEKTRSGVERGIARIFTGVWQLATFWYSDPGCVTSTKSTATAPAASAPEVK